MKNIWHAVDHEKRRKILKQLVEGDKSFNELYEAVGLGRQTLNVYLQFLVHEKCIKRVRKGKYVIYSLEKNHPYVLPLLERVRVLGEIDLKCLDAEGFLAQWLNSIEFAFLNVVQYYITLGVGIKEVRSKAGGDYQPIEKPLREYLSDMNEVCQLYGEFLSERIRGGELKPERMWIVRDKLLEKLKKDRSR